MSKEKNKIPNQYKLKRDIVHPALTSNISAGEVKSASDWAAILGCEESKISEKHSWFSPVYFDVDTLSSNIVLSDVQAEHNYLYGAVKEIFPGANDEKLKKIFALILNICPNCHNELKPCTCNLGK